MKKKVFYSGVKALAEGAIFAGCRYYYGASKILNSEILNYMASRLPEVNGVFVHTDNEHSAISMLLGSAAAGARALTTTTTDGIANMEEGFSYLSGMELPCVIGNIMSGRFGLRNYEPTQSGYIQAVRGGTASNYKFIVLAPHSVQEIYDLSIKAFDLADKYRNPVIILIDSGLAQLKESIEIDTELLHPDVFSDKPWKISGADNREPNNFKMYYSDNTDKYKRIFAKFKSLESETFAEEFMLEDAEEIYVAFGLMAKIIKGNIIEARKNGKKAGLFRPVSLSPFPRQQLLHAVRNNSRVKVVEANTGSMHLDVVNTLGDVPVEISFLGESEDIVGFRNIVKEVEKELVWR